MYLIAGSLCVGAEDDAIEIDVVVDDANDRRELIPVPVLYGEEIGVKLIMLEDESELDVREETAPDEDDGERALLSS